MSYFQDKLYERLKQKRRNNFVLTMNDLYEAIGYFRIPKREMSKVIGELERDGIIERIGNKIKLRR